MNDDDLGGHPCPRCGLSNTWVGVELRGVYDGVLYYECHCCHQRIHRWPKDHYLRDKATPFVESPT